MQKYLSMAGVASRREGERLILEGKVAVNGRVVTKLGIKINLKKDSVTVEGKPVSPERKVYLLLNKPAGYLCSLKDSFGRPLVTSLVKGIPERLFPVGRLDLDSEGLLLLTNDGAFCQKLTHPSHQVKKIYQVRLRYPLTARQEERLKKGVTLDDGTRTSPAGVTVLRGNRQLVEIRLREGRKRQVKKMLLAVGNRVSYLTRTAVGPLRLGNLPRGKWRKLSRPEISSFKASAKNP